MWIQQLVLSAHTKKENKQNHPDSGAKEKASSFVTDGSGMFSVAELQLLVIEQPHLHIAQELLCFLTRRNA